MTTGTPSPDPDTPPTWFNTWLNGPFTVHSNAVNDQRSRLDELDEWRGEMNTLKRQMEARETRQNLAAAVPAHATPDSEPAASPMPEERNQVGIPTQSPASRNRLSPRWIGLLIGAAAGILIDILIGIIVPYEFLERIPGALITLLYVLIFAICAIVGYMVGESKDAKTT